MTVPTDAQSRATRRRVLIAGNCGNFVEWFDFAIYGYLAPVLAGLFFPAGDRTTQLLSVFAVFAVSFAARPIGAMVFGPLGDRIGRRRTLAIVVLLMSGATCAIGLLPTYDSIGVAAPLLLVLCRIAQGFSAGGEYAGASIFLVEHAPAHRRGFYASFIPASSYAAFLVAVALVTGLTVALPETAMQSWGWRVPFLLAGLFGVVALFIRSRVEDTPAFKAIEATKTVARRPLRDTLRTQWKPLLVIFGIVVTDSVYYYMIWTYMPTYLSEEVGMEYSDALLANSLALTVLLVVVPLAGVLSDRIGRKPMLLGAFLGFAVLTVPAFWVAGLGQIGLAIVGQLIFLVPAFLLDTPMSAALAESFPAEVRYSSGALAYNIGYIVGGAAPFVSTLLIASTGNVLAPAFYIVALAVGSFFVVAFGFTETYRRRLSPADPEPATDGPAG
ncbi:MFS transporter [Pseudonocardia sp. MH-G8]|uniref:MFS transporter n=1 Tax=Pseudonocardia sp. MH-G8 TaxID=1854588 RepID=UPI000BA0162A|nr:MFS transporter [Pseudonocardia sp. MH-G8]OZM77087.1 MFS transporter [Pseudonocardia sp. MH-G8]